MGFVLWLLVGWGRRQRQVEGDNYLLPQPLPAGHPQAARWSLTQSLQLAFQRPRRTTVALGPGTSPSPIPSSGYEITALHGCQPWEICSPSLP